MIDELNIQDSAGRSRAAWRLIEKITGRHKRPYAVVSADSLEDRLQRYQSFFQSILDPPEPDISQVLSPLNTQHGVFNCEEITPLELAKACKSTPLGKAAGVDGLPSDVMRLTPLLVRHVLPIMKNMLLHNAPPPDSWRKSTVLSSLSQRKAVQLPWRIRGASLSCVHLPSCTTRCSLIVCSLPSMNISSPGKRLSPRPLNHRTVSGATYHSGPL